MATNTKTRSGDEATGSIAHATQVLTCLSRDIHTVTEISLQCELSKSTVHRVLKMLEQSQLVIEDTLKRRYYLGPLVSRLTSNPASAHKQLITSIVDEMQRLSNVTEETIAMDIMMGIKYYSLHEIPSRHDLRYTQENKKIGPQYAGLYAGATVKALLSQFNDERLKIILNSLVITRETENTVTDPAVLAEQIAEIKKKGYTVSYGERVPGTICIAAPVKNYMLPLVICVVGPENRLKPRLDKMIEELLVSSNRISKTIARTFGRRNTIGRPVQSRKPA